MWFKLVKNPNWQEVNQLVILQAWLRIWNWDLQDQIQLQLVAKVITTLQTLLSVVFWLKWPVHDLVLVIPPPPLIKVASNTRPYSKLGGTTLNGREEGGQYYISQTCDQQWSEATFLQLVVAVRVGLELGAWELQVHCSAMLPTQYVSYCAVFAKSAWCCTFLLLDFCRFFWNLRTSSVTKWGSSIFRKRGVTDSWGWCCCFSGR